MPNGRLSASITCSSHAELKKMKFVVRENRVKLHKYGHLHTWEHYRLNVLMMIKVELFAVYTEEKQKR